MIVAPSLCRGPERKNSAFRDTRSCVAGCDAHRKMFTERDSVIRPSCKWVNALRREH